MADLRDLFYAFVVGVIADVIVYAFQPALNAAVANAQQSSRVAGAILGIVPVLLYAVPSWVPFALELVTFLPGHGA